MLLPRLITAIIGIPLIILTVYWGGIPFFVMMFGITFLALREYYLLAEQGNYSCQPVTGMITGMILFISLFLNSTALGPLAENQGTTALLSIILIPVFAIEMFRQPQKALERISVTFLGAFFIPWALGHLLLIRSLRPGGMWYIYFLFIVIWVLDTGAYAIGKRFGRHKLAELVSPKKTIEGALGGALTAVLTALLCRAIFLKAYFSVTEAIVAGLLIACVAQFSDLAESLIKRDVGVKDSANLLPGHGGMLDRFDSFLFTAPLLYYFLTIFKKG